MADLEDVVAQLKELNATAKKQLEITGLEFGLEPTRYITRKLRTGEAIPAMGSYYQQIAPFPGAFLFTFTNPSGYVWIAIFQSIEVSQNGVIEFTGMLDDAIIPTLYIPRLVSHTINWSEALPFGFVIKETGLITYVNHDAAAQWVSVASMGVYLRKDVWERDSKHMDEAAVRYMYPAPPPMPPAA
ncbi:hypothetical protein ES703_38293 [subsurface metagenome]